MKILYTILLSFIFAVSLKGQDEDDFPKTYLWVGGGLSVPQNSEFFTDNWTLGYNFSMGFEAALSRLVTWNVVHFQYCRFSLDKERYLRNYFPELSNPSIDGRDIHLWKLWDGIKFKFFEKSKGLFPYIWFNLGLGELVRNKAELKSPDSVLIIRRQAEFELGLQVGAGLQYSVSNILAFNISGNYSAGSGFNFDDIIGDVNYFGLNLGVIITLTQTCVIPDIPSF